MTSDRLGPGELDRAAALIRGAVATERPSNALTSIRFAEALVHHTRRHQRNRRIAIAGAACMVTVSVIVTSVALQPEVLTYRVDNASEVGSVGSYMSAPAQAPLGLRFSEGSRIELHPLARGRVSEATRHGVTMVLEDGRAHAEIVHRDATNWRVLAGPFVVGVTGTTFDVGFDVATQTFELTLQSGRVRVTGPGIERPVEVHDGQHLVLSARGPDAAPSEGSSNGPAEAARGSETTVPPACSVSALPPEVTGRGVASPHRGSVPAETEVESFGQLGARGLHQTIVERAEKQGFDRTIASASRADLLALGNAARFAGRTNLANMAYRAVRDRFSKSSEATAAAFYLGRLSEVSSPAQSIAWFERYVAEAPNGVWVADALGRRMVILNESKAGPAAAAAAKEYVDRFPSGPYAGFARKLLSP
jgi:hypothetical protein